MASQINQRMVPPTEDVRSDLSGMAPSRGGTICNQIQQLTTQVCIPNARLQGLGSGCPHCVLGGPGSVCLSTSVSPGKSDHQIVGSLVQEGHLDSPGLTKHALVSESGESVVPNTHLLSPPNQSGEPTTQLRLAQGSSESQSPCLVPQTCFNHRTSFI